MKTMTIEGHNFTVVNKGTQKAGGIIKAYEYAAERCDNMELWQVYGSYSHAKANAMRYCKELQHKVGGYNGCITGHNSSFFSYAFTLDYEGKQFIAYITHANDYIVEL